MKELIEKGENSLMRARSTTERDLMLARLAKKLAKSEKVKVGRPKALTPEQVEKARQLREQGKSFSEIAEELKVGRQTVWQYLTKSESEIRKSARRSKDGRLLSAKGIRAAARMMNISHPVVARALKTAEAIRKFPFLREIQQSSVVRMLAAEGEARGLTVNQMKEAAELVKSDMPPELAVALQKVQSVAHKEKILAWYKEKTYPTDLLMKAVELVCTRKISPEEAVEAAGRLVTREYKVRIPSFLANVLEEESEATGVTPETYVVLAVLKELICKRSLCKTAADVFGLV